MTLGEALLWVGALAAAASLAARAAKQERAATLLLRAHVASVLGALLLLVVAFLVADISYEYVWAHTRPDYSAWYRLAGVWGGEAGTILLWNAVVAGALLALARKDGPIHKRAGVALLVFSGALSVILLLVRGLAATSAEELALAPSGRGLADVLLTPLMVIHPPIQFAAYALVAVPAAYALAHWWGGAVADRTWAAHAYRWARPAWFLATLGLGLGALWAYAVLSFGGYWAWDPVETSNLLPWLGLTAFLHAGKQLERVGDHPLAAPWLAVAAPLFALFATVATRSGLWVSVHAFTDPTGAFEPDPPARLLAILDVHEPTRAFVALLLAALFVALALFLLHHAKGRGQRAADRGRRGLAFYLHIHAVVSLALAGAALADPRATLGALFRLASLMPMTAGLVALLVVLFALPLVVVFLAQEERRRSLALDTRTAMSAGVALFGVALAVAFVLNAQVVNGPERAVFDVRAPYVALPMVSAITLAMGAPAVGKRAALALAAGGALAGLAAWLLAPGARVVALAAPFLLAAAIAILARLVSVLRRPERGAVAGALLLAAGIGALVVASNPPTYVAGVQIPAEWGVPLWVAGLALGVALLLRGIVALRGRLEGARLREAGIQLVHLAVIIGLLGYAASTYSQSREVFAAQPVGSAVSVGGHEFAIGEAVARAGADGRLDAVTVPLELRGEGAESLDFGWRGAPSSRYEPRLEIRRALGEDVYIAPLAFHTEHGWVGATSATAARVPVAEVDMVTFSVSVLPLVGLVWTGLWMGLVGMGFIIVGARLARRSP